MPRELQFVNFSNGIRSEEIQHNFEVLDEEIARERLAIAGHGISQGLDFTVNDFGLKIDQGSLIDITGKEIFFSQTSMNIQLPKLTRKEEVITVSMDGEVVLSNTPYALTRRTTSQFVPLAQSGITVVDYNNTSRTIPVLNVTGNIVLVDSRWGGQLVKVVYQYSNKRYDTVYIDENYEIKLIEGTTSPSPSVMLPDNYKYVLGYLLIDAMYAQDGKLIAKMLVFKDLKSLRNIYTDENNVLYIGGTPFKDLQIIHMAEPFEPEENTMWYDAISNKLRVWKTFDGISEWTYVNDTSFIPVLEYKIWQPADNPSDRRTFMFDANEDLRMRYIPGRNELSIIIDNSPLMSDQFEEIVQQDPDGLYEDIGIGFKLAYPLDKPAYIEARVTHRVNDNPIRRRFQRSATFISTGTQEYLDENGSKIFSTNVPYRYAENQLEVFVEGKKLDKDIDYIEGCDLLEADKVLGKNSKQFEVLKPLIDRDRVSYRITTSVYSYDHVLKIVEDLEGNISGAIEAAQSAVTQMEQYIDETDDKLLIMQQQVDALETQNLEHANFVEKTDVLTVENLPDSINTWIPKGLINQLITKSNTVMQLTGISPEDFITMFDMNSLGGNKVLRRGTDYEIQKDSLTGNVYLNFIDPAAVENGHQLYITGIKFGV